MARAWLLALIAIGLVLAAPARAVHPGSESSSSSAGDEAAARRAQVRRGDLRPNPNAWVGGPLPATLDSPTSCPDYHPSFDDFVSTGLAETDWSKGPVDIDTETDVLQTAQMLRDEWRVDFGTPAALPCRREVLGKRFAASGYQVIGFKRIAFRAVTTRALSYEYVITGGPFPPSPVEFVELGQGRTRVTLTLSGYRSRRSMESDAVRLARIVVGRVRT